MDRWYDDVGRTNARQLDDILSQVGLRHFDAGVDQRMIKADFFSGHTLDLDGLLDVVLASDVQDYTIGLLGIARPVDVPAVSLDSLLKLHQVMIQVVHGVQSDVMASLAKDLPAVIAKDTDHPGPDAKKTRGGLLNRFGHLRLDALHICPKIDPHGHLAHSASCAARTWMMCIGRIVDPNFLRPPATFIRHPGSLITTTSAPVRMML